MSSQNFIKGRVADALQALKGACSEFDKSINESICEEPTDENVENPPKKRKTNETPEDTVRRLKNEIIKLKSQNVLLEAAKEMKSPLFERDLMESETKLRDVEQRLQVAIRDKEHALAAREKADQDLGREKQAFNEKLTCLTRENQQLRGRIEDLIEKNSDLKNSLDNNSLTERSRHSENDRIVFDLRKKVIDLQRSYDEAAAKCQNLEEALNSKDEEFNKLYENHVRQVDESNEFRNIINENQWASDLVQNAQELEERMKIMAQWETELVQLRQENDTLRKDRSNVSLMREKLMIMDNVQETAQKTRVRCAELECDLNVSQQLCADWESRFVAHDPSLNSPELVLNRLCKLQNSELCLVEENAKIKTELEILRKGHLSNPEDSKNIKRLERKLKLITQERNSYKSVLDSYESDVTINPATIHSKRIAQLEASLDEYRKLTGELEASGGQRPKETLTSMTQTDDTEEDTKVPSNLRIIHFRDNPLDMARRERLAHFTEIECENNRLRAKIQQLEETGVASGDVTVADLLRDDPRKLKNDLEMAKKRQDRIMAAFKKTSREFRQAVYCLTGYRMDLQANRCVLRHVYAESQDDQLEFEIGENGFLHLLSNEYSQKLGDLTRDYLEKMDSIPAFLAALTMRLFNSQTFVQMEQPSMFFA